jgi:hypothetical protein
MRSLLFLLTCARASDESEAKPAVSTAPDLRKLRRVTGETGIGGSLDFMGRGEANHARRGRGLNDFGGGLRRTQIGAGMYRVRDFGITDGILGLVVCGA